MPVAATETGMAGIAADEKAAAVLEAAKAVT